jgi:predicted RNA-binding Zn ribbon-like protein
VQVADFRFYTGSVATDLVATVGRRGAGGWERLTSPERLAGWLAATSLCPHGTVATDSHLAGAVRLREAAFRLMGARIRGEDPAAADVSTVNGWARRRPVTPQLSGGFVLSVRTNDPVGSALATVARDAIRLLTDQRTGVLRACQATDCGMIYLDHSQSLSRRWCSMRECGNRAKVAAHRARRVNGATNTGRPPGGDR